MVAHYYTDPEIQQLAEETGGCISDSLEMARFSAKHPASTLLVAKMHSTGRKYANSGPEKDDSDPDAFRLSVHWISAALLKNLTHFAMPIPIVL